MREKDAVGRKVGMVLVRNEGRTEGGRKTGKENRNG